MTSPGLMTLPLGMRGGNPQKWGCCLGLSGAAAHAWLANRIASDPFHAGAATDAVERRSARVDFIGAMTEVTL